MKIKHAAVIDLYEGEFPFDWNKAKAEEVRAAIFRASWQSIGTRTRAVDSRVLDYVASAKAFAVPYGLYHFLTPNGIAEQAALFCDVYEKAKAVMPIALPPIVDVEVDLVKWYPHATKRGESSIGNAVWQGHVKTWLDIVSARLGRTPMIYTSQNFWKWVCTKSGLTWYPPSWTADYEFWVAQYFDQPDNFNSPSAIPLGVSKWSMWQYSEKGRTNGFSANDLNVASAGFVAEYLSGEIVVEPDPQPNDDDPYVSAVFTAKSGKQVTWLPKA